MKSIVPLCWEAFEDYRLSAMQLSGLEVEYIRQLMAGKTPDVELGKREHSELAAKLGHMGIRDLHATAAAEAA